MSRIKLPKGQQSKLLDQIGEKCCFDWPKLAKVSNVCERTFRDWRSEKYNMSYEALLRLQKLANISIPRNKEILPEHWSTEKASRLGAVKHNELYGNPGTSEGRSRGGLISSRKFHEDPEFAKMLGFKLRTPIKLADNSLELAEFIGIMLGDGYIKSNKTQLGISLNSETDYDYALYVQNSIKKLFNLDSSILNSRTDKSVTVLVSSTNLIEFMIKRGLRAGNKVINQVSIPGWIGLKRKYKIACLRGLMDTDGSFYSYLHRVNGKVYKNYALDFTNHSRPLLQGVRDILIDLGCTPTLSKYKVVLNKKRDIDHYMFLVGSSNSRRERKFISSKMS